MENLIQRGDESTLRENTIIFIYLHRHPGQEFWLTSYIHPAVELVGKKRRDAPASVPVWGFCFLALLES